MIHFKQVILNLIIIQWIEKITHEKEHFAIHDSFRISDFELNRDSMNRELDHL